MKAEQIHEFLLNSEIFKELFNKIQIKAGRKLYFHGISFDFAEGWEGSSREQIEKVMKKMISRL